MVPANCVKVKRDGPRGWHWIAKASFDPAKHELVDAAQRDPLDHDGDGKKGGSLPEGLTKPEIMADLDLLGIDYDKRWGRDKLDALLRKDKAAREAAVNASVEEA